MASSASSKRNLSMECCKMVAALTVVLLHVPFPESFYPYVSCLGEFANPTFFAITGYFNYRATSPQLRRRFFHIVKLYLTGYLFHFFWSCVIIELDGGSTIAYMRAAVPDPDEIIRWLTFQQDSFLGQLWFLASTGLSYLVLWGYTKFAETGTVNYRPLYQTGLTLYLIYAVLNIIMPVTGTVVDFYIYRNGWFLGLPMFFLGIFIHEYQDRLLRCFRLNTAKQLLVIFLGIALSLLQLESGTLHGTPLGTPIITAGLLFFLAMHPHIPGLGKKGQWIVSKFGTWSAGVYLFHITVQILYQRYFMTSVAAYLGDSEPWLRPFIVFFVSLLFAIAWERLTAAAAQRKARSPKQQA